MVSNLQSKHKIFADDLKVYLSVKCDDSESLVQSIQTDINILYETSLSWGLEMNVRKCKCIRFSPRNCALPFIGISPYKIGINYLDFTLSHKDLGISIDRDLKFHLHIRSKVGMLHAMTTNILSCTVCRDPDFIIGIFTYHIRPQLEYGSQLWNLGYIGDTKLLEGVQRRWTKEICGFEDLTYAERLARLNLFSFFGRLLRADLIFVWKVFHGECAVSPNDLFEIDLGRTRGHPYKIKVCRTSLEVRRRYFSVRIINKWNSLSIDTVCAESLAKFKSLLQRDLGQELFHYLD